MKEIRFRDILACENCWNLLKNTLRRTFQEYDEYKNINLKGLKVIAKEFPIVRDKIGYQIRYIDILAINNSNQIFIIELKRRYGEKTKLNSTIEQINDYEKLLKENVVDILSNQRSLSIFYYYQLEIFNYMNISIDDLKTFYKVILFMEKSEDLDFSLYPRIPIGNFEHKEIDNLAKEYVNFQINRINHITPGFEEDLKSKCFSDSLELPTYRPIPLTLIYNDNENSIFRFESLHTNKREIEPIEKSNLEVSWNLPAIFIKESKEISNEFIFNNLTKGEFIIQIFRSGRANPIIYFEYENNKYLPFHQIKSRLLQKRNLVNKVIAYDALWSEQEKAKKTIFEEVIFFDIGSYKAEIINEFGVKFKKFHLNGTRYNIEFEMIGPKINNKISQNIKENSKNINTPPLLPYMQPKKVKEQIRNFKEIYNLNPFTDDWIITNMRVKPKN